MDWDLKMPPPWDLTELDPNTEPNIGPIAGASSGMGIQASGRRLDCSVDLKLGGLGDLGEPEKWNGHLRVPMATVVPPSGTSKRARAPGNGSQNVSCLVDGCKADLSGCREYHRRHKVCEAHSKTPIVMVGAQEQRFCQQCSRFHLLVEFDEVKRSCRKRLDGHNRRRRKPQQESINPGSIFSNHQGTRFSSYPQIFPSSASHPSWPVIVKTEEDQLYSRQSSMYFLDRQHHHFAGSSFTRSFKEGSKHFPFLQDGDALEPSSICQPLLKTIATSAESSCSGSKIFPDGGLTHVLDSDCALSLLSSPPQTSALNLGQIVTPGDRIPMGQPLLPYSASLGLGQYSGSHRGPNHVSTTGFSCSGMEDDHLGNSTVLVSDGSDAEMNCHGLFGVGGEGSSDGGSQALPFSWQ